MQKFFISILKALAIISIVALVSCTKDSDDSSANEAQPTPTQNEADDGTQDEGGQSFLSQCGVVTSSGLSNPVFESNGFKSTLIDVYSHNLVAIEGPNGPIAVKLHGIDNEISEYQASLALEVLRYLVNRPVVLFEAEGDCKVTLESGIDAVIGALFELADGNNIAELLLTDGVSKSATSDACGGQLLSSCYQQLDEAAGVPLGGRIYNFLWKPSSERDGNLVILFSPAAERVVVNGENLVDFGPSNGRDSTFRASKNGCAYGSNAKVEAFNYEGQPFEWPGGKDHYIIPNGCDRTEF